MKVRKRDPRTTEFSRSRTSRKRYTRRGGNCLWHEWVNLIWLWIRSMTDHSPSLHPHLRLVLVVTKHSVNWMSFEYQKFVPLPEGRRSFPHPVETSGSIRPLRPSGSRNSHRLFKGVRLRVQGWKKVSPGTKRTSSECVRLLIGRDRKTVSIHVRRGPEVKSTGRPTVTTPWKISEGTSGKLRVWTQI